MNKPIAWINAQDLLDMQANAIIGVKDWSLTVGLKPEKGDVPLYTILPEQPTKIFGPNLEELLNGAGFYRKKEWVGLMRGVRVEGNAVVITVKGGNDEARALCGELINEMEKNK
jgi:hypothetical protein